MRGRAIVRSAARRSLFDSFWVPVAAGLGAMVLVDVAPDRRIAMLFLALPAAYLGLTAPEALRRALIALIVLETPIQFDRYYGHVLEDAALGALSGFNVSLSTFALVGLLWLWAIQRFARGRPPPRPDRLVGPAPFLYLTIVLVSAVWALDPLVAAFEGFVLLQAVALFVYVGWTMRSRDDLTFFLRLLVVAVMIQVVFMAALLLGPSLIQVGPVKIARAGTRIAGTLGGANAFGAYMAMMVPIMLALLVGGETRFDRRLGLIGLLGGLIAMIMSGSRGSWFGAVVGLGFAVLTGVRRGWIDRRSIGKVVLAATVPAVALQSVLAARLTDLNNAATQSRFPLMELALEMVAERPILGFGANNYAVAVPRFLDSDLGAAWLSTVHNKYLLVLSETGIIGLALFLWTLISLLALALSLSRNRDVFTAAVAVGLGASITANMVHMLADIFHDRVMVFTLWLVMGLVVGLARVSYLERRSLHPVLRAPAP